MNKYLTYFSSLVFLANVCVSQEGKAQTNLGFSLADMDKTAKPGVDFNKYANGGWMKAHPLTPEYARFGTFDQLIENNKVQLRSLIENLASKQNKEGSLEQKIGDLFTLAMDSIRRNAEGAKPIQADLKRIASVTSKPELFVLNAELAKKGVSSFFGVYVDADLKNSKENLVQTHQGGMTLGERDYYLDQDEATQKIMKAYKDYIVKVFSLAGFSSEEAQKKMEQVLKIETTLAKSASSATELRDVEGNYHKMTYAQLLIDYPGIDWGTLFLHMGYPGFSSISVSQPKHLKAVEELWQKESLDALKSYTEFQLINAAAGYLDDQFALASFELFGKALSGKEEQRPRWKKSLGIVNDVFGMGVGKLYVGKYFPAEAKEKMMQLIKNLQVALSQRIKVQHWMEPATQAKAQEKLNTFYVKIGYPDTWKDYTALRIDPKLSLWENMTKANEFGLADYLNRKVNKPVDRTEWLMNPQDVNAYYNPTTNEICFPAGILQPPFFDMNADDAINYGAIGVVIGHEITHGFDDQGSQFDKDGNLVNWWTKEDSKRFKERTKSMVDFFDKIKVLPDLHANGKLTLGENIADHGGLKIAFQAFQNVMAKNPQAKKMGFTPEQLFFLAYAHIWAQNIRDEQIRLYTKSDPHSLGKWRINGALPHIDAWYKAFNIKSSDPMFIPKKKRVDIW